MSLVRSLQLKKNQLILFSVVVFGLIFLVYHTFLGSTWHCWDRTKEKRFETRGKYVVLYNYVASDKDVGCRDSVTLCTHSDVDSLHEIRPTVRRFNGPISISVYCPDEDFYTALKVIAYLRKCSHDNIRKYVTFHMVFDIDFYPLGVVESLYALYKDRMMCNEYPFSANNTPVYKSKNLSYPINILRNVAKESSQTYFILSVDIKLVPTWDLAPKFMRMAKRFYESISRNYNPAAFVVPAFEIDEHTPIPYNRTYLSQVLVRGNGRVYESHACRKCHVVPNMSYKKWMTKINGDGMGIGFVTRHRHGWQPLFIGTQNEPGFDDRAFWSGLTNRLAQIYTMCYQEYTFLILDNAFLVTVKQNRNTSDKWTENSQEETYRKRLTDEFKTIFGNHKCFVLL